MESFWEESEASRMRELLARLDRVATVNRDHRAGLHLDDRALFDQYVTILTAWQNEGLDPSLRASQPVSHQAPDRMHRRPPANLGLRRRS